MGKLAASARPDFHATVQAAMRERGWGARTLAKALAGQGAGHDQVELERRSVRRWLHGSRPSQANRRRVAVALGMPEQLFDDPDEEDDLAAFLARETTRAAQRAARVWQRRHPVNAEAAAHLTAERAAASDKRGR